MHLHGHNMYILHDGDGPWDGHTLTNPHNPQRRDVQMLRPSGHLVIQYDADNAGVWPFHCHIAWHLSLVSVDRLRKCASNIDQSLLGSCDEHHRERDWNFANCLAPHSPGQL